MHPEVQTLGIMGLFIVIVGVTYLLSPFYVKRLIGENDPFERKIFHGNFPFWQLLLITFIYPVLSLLIVSLWDIVTARPEAFSYVFNDKYILWALFTIGITISYGVGAHAASVSISHYMVDLRKTRAYEVVEFYHQLLSHFVIIVGLILTVIILGMVEINHPFLYPINNFELIISVLSGVSCGVVVGFLIIEGGGKYYGFPSLLIAFVILLMVVVDSQINIRTVPLILYGIPLIVSAFLTMVFWRLKNGELRETLGDFFHTLDPVASTEDTPK